MALSCHPTPPGGHISAAVLPLLCFQRQGHSQRSIASRRTRALEVPGLRAVRTGQEDRMAELLRRIWLDDEGQDIAEYAVMLAVILVIVVGTVKLIGSNANNVFSNVASSLK